MALPFTVNPCIHPFFGLLLFSASMRYEFSEDYPQIDVTFHFLVFLLLLCTKSSLQYVHPSLYLGFLTSCPRGSGCDFLKTLVCLIAISVV